MATPELIAVTQRGLFATRDALLARLGLLCRSGWNKIILREKDLPAAEYAELAKEALAVCKPYSTKLILHTFVDEALRLGADAIHLPLHVALEQAERLREFAVVGCSVHSLEQLGQALALRSVAPETRLYVTAGHIFATACKPGLEPRGLDFLRKIRAVARPALVPVYAIGGIAPENAARIVGCGADGVCLMSYAMKADESALAALCNAISAPKA